MQFRTKLFLSWALTVLIPLAAIAWPLSAALRESFARGAAARFDGTNLGLVGVQAARMRQMRQAGTLVMSIPELRALIAESAVELSQSDRQSLQERLDYLAGQMDVSFLCVLDARGRLLAQNHASPWRSLADLQQFAGQADQPQALLRRLYAATGTPPPLPSSPARPPASQEGLWVYDGGLYEVVGIPLVFDSDAAAGARIDGALIVAVPLTDQTATELSRSHDCQITFLADGRALASSLPRAARDELEQKYRQSPWLDATTFNLSLGRDNYLSSLKPLTDAASGTRVGAMLIQTSTAGAQATQNRVLLGLGATVVLALLGALAANYLLSGVVVRPVRRLVEAARRVAQGDLNTALPVQRRDELGQLTVAFNEMVAGLRRQKELQTLVEETQAASKAKSRFLANMSHEIRTPLHGVIGMSELLMRTELSERQQRYVGLLKSSAELLTRIINDVLDFSKVEAGKLELEAVDFDLRRLVFDVIDLMAQRAEAKKLQLNARFDRTAPGPVRGDPTRLRQILLNLLSNALKFTHAGAIELRVACAAPGENPLIRFELQDTGIGIPRDRRDRLFQAFSQVDASTTRNYGGTGLGLAISRQLAELMGGQIGVESEEGKGSTFWFTVRLQSRGRETQPGAVANGPTCQVPVVRFPGKRILVAEDQEINCIVASELLTEAGLAHDMVHDGQAAVESVARGGYDLVLMDCQMPGMDGLEATRRIRRQEQADPSRPRIPIVALTANTSTAEHENCLAAGMDGFCSKPFTTQQLYDAIVAALGAAPPSHSSPVATAPPTPSAIAPPADPATIAPAPPAPAPTVAPAAPPFDMALLLQRCSGKPALAAVILEKFRHQAITALEGIEAHLAAGAAEELARRSHAVKGTAGLLGASGVQNAAARLEQMGRQQSLATAQQAVDELRQEIEHCVRYIAAAGAPAAPHDQGAR